MMADGKYNGVSVHKVLYLCQEAASYSKNRHTPGMKAKVHKTSSG